MSTSKRIVSREEWIVARKALLVKEKAFTKQRDALSAERRELPLVKIDERYVFEEPTGSRTLVDLFGGRRQLIVYHFMLEPGWDAGCRGCSYVADHFDGALVHLAARDTSFAVVSRAPVAEIEAFKERMGWTFRWLSSAGSDFNFDFNASFRPEDIGSPSVSVNFAGPPRDLDPVPGLSVFLSSDGQILHSYSTYKRGLDILLNAYNLLDLTPLGRHEEGLPHGMSWVRHHDRYESA